MNEKEHRLESEGVRATRLQAAVLELERYALNEHALEAILDRATKIVASALDIEECRVLEAVRAAQPESASFTLRAEFASMRSDAPDRASGLEVVIPGEELPYGILEAGSARIGEWSRDCVLFLQMVANLLALAIRNRCSSPPRTADGPVAEVAHDLNNLLLVIQTSAQFVLEGLSDRDAVREDVLEILRAVERSASLVHRLLSRERSPDLAFRALDLAAVLSNMERGLVRVAGEAIRVVIDAGRDLGLFEANPCQIEDVVLNLVINARDAMPRGGTVTLRARNADPEPVSWREMLPVAPPGSSVVLAVSDTGSGMAEEVRSRLFEPFFTTKPAGKGSGLGLSTVRAIVARCGGQIHVTSEMGRGSTFYLVFPRLVTRSRTPGSS